MPCADSRQSLRRNSGGHVNMNGVAPGAHQLPPGTPQLPPRKNRVPNHGRQCSQ